MPADEETQVTTPAAPVPVASGDPAAEVEPLVADAPLVTAAPGGWRRVLLGLLVGVAAGVLLALVLPRRRRVEVAPDAVGFEPDAVGLEPDAVGVGPDAAESFPGEDDVADR